LQQKTGLSRRGAEWQIQKLKNDNKIKRIGPDKGGHWEITNPMISDS
jgi:ATP-dependent DNA helicase RecG